MTAALPRRAVLPILASLPLVTLAVQPARASDVALISAEAEVIATDAALSAIFATDYEDTSAEAEVNRLSACWCGALQRMADTPAVGLDGMAAKARVVRLLSDQRDLEMVAALAPSLAADVLRLRGMTR